MRASVLVAFAAFVASPAVQAVDLQPGDQDAATAHELNDAVRRRVWQEIAWAHPE